MGIRHKTSNRRATNLTKMKFQMSLLIGLTIMFEFCQVDAKAQFGVGQVQNCQFSSCTQNNFGRKRRQILEEILAEVEAAEVAVTDEVVEPVSKAKRQVQTCVGSSCNQNNFGRKKRQIAEAIHALTVDVLESEDHPDGAVTDEVVEPVSKVKRQVQTCVGSSCNQNNFGRKKRQIAEAIDALTADVLEDENEAVAKAKRDAEAQSQNCFGGSGCNQNNFGRRKREVIAALLQELQ